LIDNDPIGEARLPILDQVTMKNRFMTTSLQREHATKK